MRFFQSLGISHVPKIRLQQSLEPKAQVNKMLDENLSHGNARHKFLIALNSQSKKNYENFYRISL
jgi:hypothetical protein